jgi:type IV pilus assembly protein PilC
MLEAGESAGELGTALEMSATYLEKQTDLRRKVKSAFAYPIAVCAVCLVAIVGLLIFIVPIFTKLYKQLQVSLPGPTQVLVELSALVRNDWWQVLIVAAGLPIAVVKLSKNPRVRAKWDVFKLNMPVFAKLNRMVVVSQFMRTFAMLASVGVSLIRALEVASAVANNHRMSEITKELQQRIEAGNPVAKALSDYDIFPPMVIQLAASGEEVGALAEMLSKGVDFLDKDIDRTVSALLVKLEPALTVIAGAIVGFLLMAVYLPMFDYMSNLK